MEMQKFEKVTPLFCKPKLFKINLISGLKTEGVAAARHVEHKAESSAIQGQMCKINMKKNYSCTGGVESREPYVSFPEKKFKTDVCIKKIELNRARVEDVFTP